MANLLSKDTIIFVASLAIGMAANMALVYAGVYIIPLPKGLDVSTQEGLKAALPLLKFQHFIFPFLAHAFGTLIGSYCVSRWSAHHKQPKAWVISAIFFIGGLMNIIGMPSPLWFSIADLIFAYFPMAWFVIRFLGSPISISKI